ncbi:MAG: hypothetical protein ACUVX9_14875 [Anaerolineae bacterium]
MRCPFCQQEMGDARLACPACGRKHSPYVAYTLQQGWAELQHGAPDRARSAFDEAMRYTPENDRAYLQQYINYLLQQAPSTAAAPGATPAVAAGAAAAPAPAQARASDAAATVPLQTPPTSAVTAVPRRSSARAPASGSGRWVAPIILGAVLLLCLLVSLVNRWTGLLPFLLLIGGAIVAALAINATKPTEAGGNARALFLNFNERPSSVVKVMDDARTQQMAFARSRRTRQWLLALLFPAGLFFVMLDLALGYNMQTFTLAGLSLWAAAIIGLALLGRDKPTGKEFGPRFEVARQVFATIKDDLAPGRTLVGWLDLTGPQPGKIAREGTSATGYDLVYYRDEWLRLKLSLYDGNMLRLSCLDRIKSKLGRWKRSIRGKHKWKAGKSTSRQQVQVTLTLNPQAYELRPVGVAAGSKFEVQLLPGNGRVELLATTNAPVEAADILWLLRVAYAQLKPLGTGTSTGG